MLKVDFHVEIHIGTTTLEQKLVLPSYTRLTYIFAMMSLQWLVESSLNVCKELLPSPDLTDYNSRNNYIP